MSELKCTLNAIAVRWLEERKKVLKPASVACYSYQLSKYILPEIGGIRMDSLDSAVIEGFCRRMQEIGLSAGSINRDITILRMVMKFAEAEGYTLPAKRDVTRLKGKKRRVKVLSAEEREKLEEYLLSDECVQSNGVRTGVLLSLYAGLRIGEVCGLKWGNLDLSAATLSVESTLSRIYATEDSLDDSPTGGTKGTRRNSGKNGSKTSPKNSPRNRTRLEYGSPKTEHSVRVIPLPEFLTEFASPWRMPRECFVLTGRMKPMEPRCYQNRFRDVCAGAGISQVNYHTLRHTFATRCIEKGFDIKALSEILGHASVNTTMDLYVHPTMDMKMAYMNRLYPERRQEQSQKLPSGNAML